MKAQSGNNVTIVRKSWKWTRGDSYVYVIEKDEFDRISEYSIVLGMIIKNIRLF